MWRRGDKCGVITWPWEYFDAACLAKVGESVGVLDIVVNYGIVNDFYRFTVSAVNGVFWLEIIKRTSVE